MRAKSKGLLVYAETLAAALGSDGTKLWDKDWDVAARYVNSPCLSPDPKTKTQIMKYINNGVIDVVGTDNCTFCTAQRRMGKETIQNPFSEDGGLLLPIFFQVNRMKITKMGDASTHAKFL